MSTGPSKELWLTDPVRARALERGEEDPRQLSLFDVVAPTTPPRPDVQRSPDASLTSTPAPEDA